MSETVTIAGGGHALVLELPPRGMPRIVAFGAAAEGATPSAERAMRTNGMDVAVPSAVLLPTGGMGYFGWPAIAGHRQGRDFVADFASWSAKGDATRHTFSGIDKVAKLALDIEITVSSGGVFSMRSVLTNQGATIYTVDRCMAASLLIDAGEGELTSFTGIWGREMHTVRSPLGTGLWLQESRRGRTSHDKFPGVLLTVGGTTSALHLGWSGNHVIAIDLLDDGRRLVHAGELFEPGEMRLAPGGGSYESPWAHFTAAPGALPAFVRAEVLRWPGHAMKPRPVLLNTWEGTYFDHKLDQLKAQATAAAALGIERFVLDDGWFGRRDNDRSSLGDWFVDKRKYPEGLAPLVNHVVKLGMEFGIWVEPEMISQDSDLYRAHPDWALQIEGRPLLPSRQQLVLDLTRKDVTDYLYDRMHDLLSSNRISYVKWDMNRDITHSGDSDGSAATARQTRAVYALMDRLHAAHPSVEIESCASGGGRNDYAVLRRTHRLWTSDCTDALERLEIQRGTATFFPREIMGSHISASPNHQTHRRHSLSFRALVAIAYHMGVELNPLTLSEPERAELKGWIALHQRLRALFHAPEGQFQLPPIDGRYIWGTVARDRMVAVVAQGPHMLAEQPPPLRLPAGNATAGTWRIVGQHPAQPEYIRISEGQKRLLSGGATFSLQTLTHAGLPLPMLRPESGVLLEFERVTTGA